MTRQLRAKLVEFLRCVADNAEWIDTFGFAATRADFGYPRYGLMQRMASSAFLSVIGSAGKDWVASCLEVAQRVEEGRWP